MSPPTTPHPSCSVRRTIPAVAHRDATPQHGTRHRSRACGTHDQGLAIGLILLLLSGCAAVPPAPSTPDAVHAAWVTALATNQRDAAAALLAPDTTLPLDIALAQVQAIQHANHPLSGSFQRYEILPLPHDAPMGWSRWQWERLATCFRTTLVPTAAGWRVSDWREHAPCPPEVTP